MISIPSFRNARRLPLALAVGLLVTGAASANNLSIRNVSLTDQNAAENYLLVRFDLSWENSWRVSGLPYNWDAAWVFVKFRLAGGDWQHATLHTSGHSAPNGFADAASDGTGVFVYRASDGTGDVSYPGVQLRWNYGADGVDDLETEFDVHVVGIEMVYVPNGAFAAGSGGTEISAFTLTTINTANASTAPSGTGSLGGQAGGYPSGQTAPAANWPNGFSAFYIQKYETSQGQYAEFLNLLTSTQASARAPGGVIRYTITGNHPNFSAGVPDRACNNLSWADGAAYADWAGLRPMTELEYEKASRGTIAPVPNEYAWGTTNLYASPYTLTNDGQPGATISNPGSGTGNANYTVTDSGDARTLRVGIFAASVAAPSRQESGAAFYGVMELSGNLTERAVTINNATGRSYTGTHGDGRLAANGHADASTWPGADAEGAGYRGGSFPSTAVLLRISDRNFAASTDANRVIDNGWRGVRSAP